MATYGLTPQGPNIKRLDVILEEMHEDMSKKLGVNTRQNPQSILNHMMTNIADRIAELWEFIDVPVAGYSSGMLSRLGFAIATLSDADIVIADEVLSVGDARFRQKCEARMSEMLREGVTILFVSHSAAQVQKICRRAIWLDRGQVRMDGPSGEVCRAYESR